MHKKKTKHRSIVVFFIKIVLTIVPLLIFSYTYSYRRYYKHAVFWDRGNYVFLLLYTAILVIFITMYGGYRLRQSRTRELVFSFGFACLLTNGLTYFIMSLIARELLNPWALILTAAVQCIAETFLYILCRLAVSWLEPPEAVLCLLNEEEDDGWLSAKFDKRRTRFTVDRIIRSDLPEEELFRTINHYDVILLGAVEKELRERLLGYCYEWNKSVLLKPDMKDIMLGSAESIIMSDMLLYELNTRGADKGYLAAKRALDIVVSLLGLIVTSPIFFVTAIAIKKQDGGPVFYRQTRLTQNGREFQLTKFRSMVVNAESVTGAVLAGKTDNRITKVGRFIRATRIDELPQLLNILKGDMSLVGPRPERPEFYEKYCAEYPEFAYRLKVRAGLTGYAQLYGKYNTGFADKARLDVAYIQKASLLWDLQLIFYTLKIIFIKESTEGVEKNPQADENKEETVSVE